MSFNIEALESRQMLSGSPNIVANTARLIFSQPKNTVSAAQYVTLRNTGTKSLSLNSVNLAGADAGEFTLRRKGLPAALAPGQFVDVKITFKPTAAAVRGATLQVASNDADTPLLSVTLRGLGTDGRFDVAEPSLQRILQTFQIPVNVGDTDITTAKLDGPAASDEIPMQLLKKAAPGLVKLTQLASFTWASSPVASFGWYRAKGTQVLRPVMTTLAGNEQTLLPATTKGRTFDPGSGSFGLYSNWPAETHVNAFSENYLNSWDHTADNKHKYRFYPYKNASGAVVPNTYVVGIEEAFNSDFQDAVFIIENVMPANAAYAPSNLVATPASSTSIHLAWADNSDNETGFIIERTTKKTGTFSVVGTVGPNVKVFDDTQLAPGTLYYYRIRANSVAGASAPTDRAVAKTGA